MVTAMIGQATARAERAPRRWVHATWGHPYLHKRQDWRAVWPALDALPTRGLRVLDAGCGAGWWTLELAARRPEWQVVGIDRDGRALDEAEDRRRRLGIGNASFEQADVDGYAAPVAVDVVLSVCAAHYAAEAGRGAVPFARAAASLRPGGLLLLYGPRRRADVPFVRGLPRPAWHAVYSEPELRGLCDATGFRVESLTAHVGTLGTVAGQLDLVFGGAARRIALATGLYAVQLLLQTLDAHVPREPRARSLMWLLAARRDA